MCVSVRKSYDVLLVLQVPSKVPVLFNPAGVYDAQSVLLISLAETPITLTADQVISMPWRQFVRLMKALSLTVAPCTVSSIS